MGCYFEIQEAARWVEINAWHEQQQITEDIKLT